MYWWEIYPTTVTVNCKLRRFSFKNNLFTLFLFNKSQVGDRITIVPAGGINEQNLSRILDGCGATEFHASARISRPSKMVFHRNVPMGGAMYPPENLIKTSCKKRIEALIDISKSCS